MAFIGITATEIAASAALAQELFQKIKDNFDDLYSRIFGVGIEIKNGSFELDTDDDGVPDNWTFTAYPGGSGVIDITVSAHGTNSFKMVHPGGSGNGGGYLDSDYYPISETEIKVVTFNIMNSVTGCHNGVTARYFDTDKVTLSADEVLHNVTNTGTSWEEYSYAFTVPANARWMKIRLIGGNSDTDVASSIYFDNVRLEHPTKTPHVKTTYGSLNVTSAGALLPGGNYGFVPTQAYVKSVADGMTYVSDNAQFQQYYITASGKEYWPFVAVDTNSGQIISYWCAPDHPSSNNSGDENRQPHPWPSYYGETPSGIELVLLCMETYRLIEGIRSEQKLDHWDEALMWALENGYKIDFETEVPWVPRDMNGQRKLVEQHGSYKHRRIIKEEKE